MTDTHSLRLQSLIEGEAFTAANCRAILVTGLINIRYLTGFTGSNGLLLVSARETILFTDPRYALQAPREVSCAVTIGSGSLLPLLADQVKRRRWKRLGFERNRASFEQFEDFRAALPPACDLVPIESAVETLRMIKSAEEIDLIRESVITNSRALRRALKSFHTGMRERDLATEIDYQARRAGAEAPAFETIVASGPRSALPHARPTSEKIRDKEILLIDMGCMVNGYASDMTRSMHVGKASRKVRTLYDAVHEAQLAAIAAVRPGIAASDVDKAARDVLDAQGFGEAFVHSTGHGLGLEIHEGPRLGKNATAVLAAGMAITIEPGAYIEDFGGIRIEDTVVVTDTGCEILTPTHKDFLEL